LRLREAAIVVLPAALIGVVTVVDPVASVVETSVVVAAVVVMVAVIAARLRPVQPAPSVGLSAIVRRAIARSRTVRSVIVHLRIVRRRGGVRSRRVLPVVAHSVIDLLAIGLSVTALAPRATVVHHFNRVTGLPGRMPAGHSLVQPVRNAVPNHPARTSFGGLGLHSFPKVGGTYPA